MILSARMIIRDEKLFINTDAFANKNWIHLSTEMSEREILIKAANATAPTRKVYASKENHGGSFSQFYYMDEKTAHCLIPLCGAFLIWLLSNEP